MKDVTSTQKFMYQTFDLQNSAIAQQLTKSTHQLTNLFYGAVAVTKKVE